MSKAGRKNGSNHFASYIPANGQNITLEHFDYLYIQLHQDLAGASNPRDVAQLVST